MILPYPTDLTEYELEVLENAYQTGRRPAATFAGAASEIRRHRAAVTRIEALLSDDTLTAEALRRALRELLGLA